MTDPITPDSPDAPLVPSVLDDMSLRVTALGHAADIHKELLRGNPLPTRQSPSVIGSLIDDAEKVFAWLRHGHKPDAATDTPEGK